jgi:hypothetical protein
MVAMPCRRAAHALLVVAGLVATQACTGSVSTSSSTQLPPGYTSDAGATTDAGSSSAPEATPYPAVAASVPQVQSAGGAVLASPRIVPVFFPGEADAVTLGGMITGYAASAEWAGATAQYGVGAATVAASVTSLEPFPSGLTTAGLGTWIVQHLDGTHPEWGPIDEATIGSSIYLLYPPAGVTLYAPGSGPSDPMVSTLCGPHTWDLPAWHWQTVPAPGPYVPVAFAVVGRCTSGGTPLLDRMTAATSHELVEAATDPDVQTSPAYAGVDDAHAFWMKLTGGGEVGDLCDPLDIAHPADVGSAIQRTWSNSAAAAGHDPCVPTRGGVYFTVAADAPDAFLDPYVGKNVQGVAVPLGQSRTIDVHLVSDSATDPWQIAAVDPNAALGGAHLLKTSLDRATGSNGDVAHLTIEPLVSVRGATALYEIDSTQHGVTHRWYGEIVVR